MDYPMSTQTSVSSPRAPASVYGAILAAVAICLLAVWSYWPALAGGFIWDDDFYVVNNPALRSWGSLVDIWFRPTRFGYPVGSQYYPLVYSSFLIEYQLWGTQPLGYHVNNLVLHLASAGLLWLAMRRLQIPGAALAATLFALHPVQVESVAWVTERKNVLSCFFYLGAFNLYRAAVDRDRARRRLLLGGAWVVFLCALLSKSVACSFPAALLVVHWAREGRVDVRHVRRLLPFFVPAIVLGLLTVFMERAMVGATGSEWRLGVGERVILWGRTAWFYLGKLVWPHPLIFNYPRWEVSAASPRQWIAPAMLLTTLLTLWALRARIGRWPLAVLLLYLGTLFPASGFFNVYPFRYSYVADHFQYHATFYGFAGAATLAALLYHRLPHLHLPLVATAAGVCLVLGLLTRQQSRSYVDAETLYRHTIAANPGSWFSHTNLGQLIQPRDGPDAALKHYEQALRLNPNHPEAVLNRGAALEQKGDREAARAAYQRAIALKPRMSSAYFNLGHLLREEGRADAAVAPLQRAIRLDPGYARAHNDLALALGALNRIAEATGHAHMAVQLEPTDGGYLSNLGILLARQGRTAEAREVLSRALELSPANEGIRQNLQRLEQRFR